MTNRPPKRLFEFGPFTIDPRERLLVRGGLSLPVTPKAFEILLALVENHGHVLGKDELIERVWPDAFVEAGNLNRNISTLRNLLGDDSHEPQFIRTLPKVGYRFEAQVNEIIDDGNTLNGNGRADHLVPNSKPVPGYIPPSVFGRRRPAILLGAAVVLALFSMLWIYSNGALRAESGGVILDQTKESRDPVVNDLYRRGRLLWQDRTGESLHRATLLLEHAVAADPDFAQGYAALADAYAFDGQNSGKAIETASKAIALDPTLGEPHATIGFVKMFWEWKFYEADEHFRRAVTLSPKYATGHQWYAINLASTWRGGAALAEMQRALELEPDSLAINADMCQLLYFGRRLDDAETQCKKTLEMDPKFLSANLYLYDIYMAKGMYDEAVGHFLSVEEMVVHYAFFPGQLDELKYSYATGGIRSFWQKRIEMLEQLPARDYEIAKYKARLGEKDQAFAHLRKSYEARDVSFMTFLAEPLFLLCCYSDPQFQKLEAPLMGN